MIQNQKQTEIETPEQFFNSILHSIGKTGNEYTHKDRIILVEDLYELSLVFDSDLQIRKIIKIIIMTIKAQDMYDESEEE